MTPGPEEEKETPWMDIAKKEIGISEIYGSKHNIRILEYHKHTSLRASDDETAWCAAFTNFCVDKAGYIGTGKPNARSWLEFGEVLLKPEYGAVVIMKRGKYAWQGHVGFVVSWNRDTIQVLGGNQGDRVCIKNFPRKSVIGFRWPSKALSDA